MFRYALPDGLDRYPSHAAARTLTTTASPRLPVTLVCGFLGAGKTTLIRRWLRHAPRARRWAVVVNERGATSFDDLVFAADAGPGPTVIDLADACACCVAEPVLRRRLPRLGALDGCERVIIELSGQGQPQRIADLLRSNDLAARFELERIVTVVAAARASPYRRLDDPSAPALARALANAQIEAADQIWLRSGDGEETGLTDLLAGWRPFGRFVSTDVDAFEAPHGAPAGRIDAAQWLPLGAHPAGGYLDRWVWPGHLRLSRARFVRALTAWPPTPSPRSRLHAVLITERETYEWRIEGASTDDSSSTPIVLEQRASAYRTCSRIDLHWHDPATRDWLAQVVAELAPVGG